MSDKWRVIDTGANPAYVNMAIDEALLDAHILTDTLPVLRFYTWQKPSLSLGRNQELNNINLEACRNLNIEIVRRPTGGNAVFHNKDLCFSFISDLRHGIPDTLTESYKAINQALIIGMKKLDKKLWLTLGNEITNSYFQSPNCFATSTIADLNFKGLKVIGSSQLRRKKAFLIHYEIMISDNFYFYPQIFKSDNNTESQTTLKNILEYEPSVEKIKTYIIFGFEKYFNIIFENFSLNDTESEIAQSYYKKYQIVF